MSAEIEQQTGIAPVLEAGSGGIFDVFKGSERIFSKHQAGRFPENGELTRLLAS